jgi:FAD/FMN-containing dehydrogenase
LIDKAEKTTSLCYHEENDNEGDKGIRGHMSKVATYLQEHILGEVTTNPAILAAMSHDLSVLEMTPEMVVYPRVTNDIRKIARFSWQLAEKGHVLGLTARGGGTDETGGAIGKGIAVVTPAHLNQIFEFDAKQKLVRLQPGVMSATLNEALAMQGMFIPALPESGAYSTVGGAIAKNSNGMLAGKYGDMNDWVSQLEVVLANGDVLQTERISKRDLNKKKGQQNFEGEIYRSLDNLIEDNRQLIEQQLGSTVRDNAGYSMISKVKHHDGSFDLTPLLIGSQGTLGIISEMIMKTEFKSANTAAAVIGFVSGEAARDALDQVIDGMEPAFVEFYDGDFFTVAATRGKSYNFIKNAGDKTGAVVVVGFDDFSDHARTKKLKRLIKQLNKTDAYVEAADDETASELLAIREVTAFAVTPDEKAVSAPPIVDGAYVPRERTEEFMAAVKALVAKYGIVMPVHARVLDHTFYARPLLQLHKVGDKQKIFKLLDEYAGLVAHLGGHLIGNGGEGRVKAQFAYKQLDPEVIALFEAVRAIFDPHGILNPGVKQPTEIRQLVSHLRSGYDAAAIAQFVPFN